LFAVALRFRQDTGFTMRRNSAVQALTRNAEVLYSMEPALLALVQYDRASSDLTHAVTGASKFASATDLMLAINLSSKGHAYFGNATESEIRNALGRR
jgi:hypothetical protein